jgi:hypothetical protein
LQFNSIQFNSIQFNSIYSFGSTLAQLVNDESLNLVSCLRRWSAAEDKMLTAAVQTYGSGNWAKIKLHVPGRTDVQCRERWCNVLDPSLQASPWTDEEDKKLLNVVELIGIGKWAQVEFSRFCLLCHKQ